MAGQSIESAREEHGTGLASSGACTSTQFGVRVRRESFTWETSFHVAQGIASYTQDYISQYQLHTAGERFHVAKPVTAD